MQFTLDLKSILIVIILLKSFDEKNKVGRFDKQILYPLIVIFFYYKMIDYDLK